FKFKEQKKPKSALAWHTGLSSVPPDSVRCTRTVQLTPQPDSGRDGRNQQQVHNIANQHP
ncbi:hypothetical protein ACJX0J_027929, partial [Zea mays]